MTHTRVPTALPDPLPLVGRADDLADLERLLESDRQGPRVVFVHGEAGTGKSRLLEELAARAARRSWSVVQGRAYPVETGVPYAVLSDAWLPVLSEMDDSTLTVLSRGGTQELAFLFPGLGKPSAAIREAAASEPDELRTRLLWTFAEFTRRFAARTPTLCILEDLHWADESSIEMLHFCARQLAGAPVLFVCSYTRRDRDANRALVRAERSLASIGLGTSLEISPFTRDQITELIVRSFVVEPEVARDFASVLYGWTRGNPFFAREILHSLVANGRLRMEGGQWVGWDATDFELPGSVRDAIRLSLSELSEGTRAVLETAAVVGNRISYALLESITALGPSTVLNGIEELVARSILDERSDRGRVLYDFRHPMVQQTVYDDFGLQRVRILHGHVAVAMEAFHGADADAHADELAYHYARADESTEQAKALRYLTIAGRAALDRRADAEAINYLSAALQTARSVPLGTSGPGDEPSETAREIVPLLARAHTHVGAFDAAAALWTEAVRSSRPDDPRYPGYCRSLGITNVWRGRHDEATRDFDAGLAAVEENEDRGAKIRLLVAKAHGLHEVGRADDALAVLRPALVLAEEVDDAGMLARVHRALALLHVWVGPPEEALKHGRRAIELGDVVGDLSTRFWARWGLAVLKGMRGDTEGMAAALEELNEIADDAHSPVLRLWTADMAVELAYARGDWDAGVALGEHAIALARSLHQRTLLPRLLVWTSQFHVARGELDRAEALVQEAVEASGIEREEGPLDVHQVVPTYIGLAHYLVHLGDYDDAIDAATRGLRIAEGTGYTLWAIHQLLPIYAEACLWAGRIDEAATVGARMRSHAERIDHRIGIAWADACDALVQWKRGDAGGAVDRMLAAADELESIPMMWTATRLRRQVAGRMIETGRRDEGIEQLARVHAACVSVNAGLELEKTRSMYRDLGMRPPSIRSSDGPLGLTRSETRVARLVAEGMSNKAIAAELRCATRTVSTHLSNMYGKLDIGGPGARVRLGNLAREAGLLEGGGSV